MSANTWHFYMPVNHPGLGPNDAFPSPGQLGSAPAIDRDFGSALAFTEPFFLGLTDAPGFEVDCLPDDTLSVTSAVMSAQPIDDLRRQ